MVCSNCGSENPATNRFCGMCGTPLPQRPLTAPGATSTLAFTRLPLEMPRTTTSSSSKPSPTVVPATPTAVEEKPAVVTPPEPPAAPVKSIEAPAAEQPGRHLVPEELRLKPEPPRVNPVPVEKVETPPIKAEPAVRPAAPAKGDGKHHNYFAEAEEATSLEQFVAGFHYTPPVEEDELTMTGDRPVVETADKYETHTPIGLTEEAAIGETTAPAETASPVESAPVTELSSTEKAASVPPPVRSKFLDISEPEAEHPRSGTSTIVGPSFLGLSDPPAAPIPIEQPMESSSHWRAWVAVMVVVLFAGLGYLEWRSGKNQSNNGPIEVMKMQIQRLKGKKGAMVSPENSTEGVPQTAAPAQPVNNNAGPDMQVVPQQKPQSPATNPPANTTNPPTGNQPVANPGSADNGPNAPLPVQVQPLTPGGGVGNGDVSQAHKPADTNTILPGKTPSATASTSTSTGNAASPAAKQVPGAEELAKAENASDAAAASAWLWKAVAKGNPTAPVRLADMYIKGDGVGKSCEQAVVLLKSAAAKDNAAARSKLGSLYATGTCVSRDRVRAFQYMSSALDANPNATWARDFREQLWNQMTPQERTLAEKYK